MHDCANDISVAERSILQPNTSVSSEGIFDFEWNQNLERVIVWENSNSSICDNSESVVTDMVECENDFSVAENDFVCPDCLKTFKYKYNLKRHVYKFHHSNTTLIESLKNQSSVVCHGESFSSMVDCANDFSLAESNFVCPDCLKTFKNKYNLKRHANKLHSNNTALIDSLKSDRSLSYKCEDCHLKFSDLKNLKYHQNKIHTSKVNQTGNYVCPLCYANFEKREKIFHFKNVHDVDMNHTALEFNSFYECLAWKAETEINTKSKFVSYGTKHCNIHGVKYCYEM
ncbi:zinc finger protein 567-like [Stegodyphus dumicola]|uniref:zinc finger protein 567-like n=1 Tax=Stegodyphus dumicola TaxID=202533 RepID=UPI0015A99D61|nr:zinc finger protein 567-like [Stegodyphus dumicola]